MKKLLLILIILFCNACASVSFAPAELQKKYSKKTNPQDIKIYRSELPKGEFIEIGSLSGSGQDEAIITKFREQASEQGGDAIISLETFSNGYSATIIRMK